MKHIVNPNTPVPPKQASEKDANISSSDISIQRLIDDSLIALHREVKNLLTLSARGKLEASDARDLRDHLKLLFELKDREADSLNRLTDAQLKEQAQKALSETE